MHVVTGSREPDLGAQRPVTFDDATDRRAANRAVGWSALGLAVTGLVELLLAIITGSVGLLGDAFHNLSDVSTSLVVFLGFRVSRRPASDRYPYGLERAEDLAGLGVALVIWGSAVFAGVESVRKLIEHGSTHHVGIGIAGAAIGIIGNQAVARYKLRVGTRINSATLVGDAKHSRLDAVSSLGALLGLVAVAFGARWGDPVAGIAVTLFIVNVGVEVTKDIGHRLLDGIDSGVLDKAEMYAMTVAAVQHAQARGRWTGLTLRLEVEAWLDADSPLAQAEAVSREVRDAVLLALPDARVVTVSARPVPVL